MARVIPGYQEKETSNHVKPNRIVKVLNGLEFAVLRAIDVVFVMSASLVNVAVRVTHSSNGSLAMGKRC